jgi:hypothetical protein
MDYEEGSEIKNRTVPFYWGCRHHLQGQFTKDQGVDYEDENKI